MTGAVADTRTMEFDLAHVGPRSLFTRRRVVVRHADETLARIRLGRGLWRVRGECLTNEGKYVYEFARGPLERARVRMRRAADGATVGEAAEPRRWRRRMALRGGVAFTHKGVTYDLRPRRGRDGGAQIDADGHPVGSITPTLGATRCTATVPTALDERARLLLVTAAVALGLTISRDVPTPGGGVPGGASRGSSGAPQHVTMGGLDGRGPG